MLILIWCFNKTGSSYICILQKTTQSLSIYLIAYPPPSGLPPLSVNSNVSILVASSFICISITDLTFVLTIIRTISLGILLSAIFYSTLLSKSGTGLSYVITNLNLTCIGVSKFDQFSIALLILGFAIMSNKRKLHVHIATF